MVVQEIILAKKVGGHQLAPNDIKSLTFVSFFPMKEIYSLFTHISWYKGEFAKKNQRFNHSLLISLWQIELLTTYSVWFKFQVLL